RDSGSENLILPERSKNLPGQGSANERPLIHLINQEPQKSQIFIVLDPHLVDKANCSQEASHTEGASGLDGDQSEIGGVQGTDDKRAQVGRVINDDEVKVQEGIIPQMAAKPEEAGRCAQYHFQLQRGSLRDVGGQET